MNIHRKINTQGLERLPSLANHWSIWAAAALRKVFWNLSLDAFTMCAWVMSAAGKRWSLLLSSSESLTLLPPPCLPLSHTHTSTYRAWMAPPWGTPVKPPDSPCASGPTIPGRSWERLRTEGEPWRHTEGNTFYLQSKVKHCEVLVELLGSWRLRVSLYLSSEQCQMMLHKAQKMIIIK